MIRTKLLLKQTRLSLYSSTGTHPSDQTYNSLQATLQCSFSLSTPSSMSRSVFTLYVGMYYVTYFGQCNVSKHKTNDGQKMCVCTDQLPFYLIEPMKLHYLHFPLVTGGWNIRVMSGGHCLDQSVSMQSTNMCNLRGNKKASLHDSKILQFF